jgi:hypothetical protein
MVTSQGINQVAGTVQPNQQVASATLLTRVEALLAKLDAQAKAEEAKAASSIKTFFSKHWPWMAGVVVAATRFIHL